MTALQAPPRPVNTTAPTAAPTTAVGRAVSRIDALEDRAVQLLRRFAPRALRVSLATTFVWFGALKVAAVPTLPAALIAAILPVGDPAVVVPIVGVAEVALGLWVLSGWRMPLALLALAGHLAGTFLVLVLRPDVAFQGGNPLLLSVEGEYVVKNLVLLAGALMLAAHAPSRSRDAVASKRV